uniref:Uncharacterized protein n=1 Tax=Pristionchus pacificus TaxID=54126 RepID=A0A2A6B762_PRIPA|eukprot:PDM61708.1 hypothetical protein PRIPAC_51150 [Pristionchus pacificus]
MLIGRLTRIGQCRPLGHRCVGGDEYGCRCSVRETVHFENRNCDAYLHEDLPEQQTHQRDHMMDIAARWRVNIWDLEGVRQRIVEEEVTGKEHAAGGGLIGEGYNCSRSDTSNHLGDSGSQHRQRTEMNPRSPFATVTPTWSWKVSESFLLVSTLGKTMVVFSASSSPHLYSAEVSFVNPGT